MNEIKQPQPFKLGILGCAAITPAAVIQPLKSVPQIEAYGIAGRDPERTCKFARQYEIPMVFDSYDALLAAEEIDCVYLPLANSCHFEWAMKAALAHKGILLEKPACLKAAEFRELEKVCRQQRVELLEAVMVQHHPWQKAIAELVVAATFGRLKKVSTRMSFIPEADFAGNYRAQPEQGGGVFWDLGSYWIQFAQAISELGGVTCQARSRFDGPNGCDWNFEAGLVLPDSGVVFEFTGSFERPYQASHRLEFEDAVLMVPDFFRANVGNHPIVLRIETRAGEALEPIPFPAQNYYVNQLRFWAGVLDGTVPNLPLEQTEERIALMERMYHQARQNQS